MAEDDGVGEVSPSPETSFPVKNPFSLVRSNLVEEQVSSHQRLLLDGHLSVSPEWITGWSRSFRSLCQSG